MFNTIANCRFNSVEPFKWSDSKYLTSVPAKVFIGGQCCYEEGDSVLLTIEVGDAIKVEVMLFDDQVAHVRERLEEINEALKERKRPASLQ